MYPKLQTAQTQNFLLYKALIGWRLSKQNPVVMKWLLICGKGKTESRALKFIWHIYWISFVCLSGLYAGSSTPHHSTSVELLSPAPNPNSISTTDLPARQHRLDRDLGSPHHLSPLAAMDGTRDGWVLRGCIQLWRCVIQCLLCYCQGRQRAGNINIKSGKMSRLMSGKYYKCKALSQSSLMVVLIGLCSE